MSIERRLREHLGSAAAAIPEPDSDVATVARRGRRRRAVQSVTAGAAAVAVVLIAGASFRDLMDQRVAFKPAPTPAVRATVGATPSDYAPSRPAPLNTAQPQPSAEPGESPAQPPAVRLQDLGADVVASGGRGVALYTSDGHETIYSGGRVDEVFADGRGGVVVQSGGQIIWVPEHRGDIRLVDNERGHLLLRGTLPDGRVLYSVTDAKRSEDMQERFFAISLAAGAKPELLGSQHAFETWYTGPVQRAGGELVGASCHMVCSIYEFPEGERVLYHGGGGVGAAAAIEGLSAAAKGEVLAFVEFLPTPGMTQPQLVVVDGSSFDDLARIPLPVDRDRAVGAVAVSMSRDGSRHLVTVESRPDYGDAPSRRDVFLVELDSAGGPTVWLVAFKGVVRWLDAAAAPDPVP